MNRRAKLSVAVIAAITTLGGGGAGADPGGGNWTVAGGGLQNTRHQASEHELGIGTVANLQVKWMFTAAGDVSATPAVHGGRVYVPDWAGYLYAIDRETGEAIWRASIAAASGVPGDKARTTPAVAGGKVYIGTQGPFGGGGRMLAFDADKIECPVRRRHVRANGSRIERQHLLAVLVENEGAVFVRSRRWADDE